MSLNPTQFFHLLTQLELTFKEARGDHDEFFNLLHEGNLENDTSDEEIEELNLIYNEAFAYLDTKYFR